MVNCLLSYYIMLMAWLVQSIQAGRFSIPIWLLSSIAALAAAYVVMRLLFRRDKAYRTAVLDLVFNAFFIFFLVWKLSPLVFRFSQITGQPSALLFLPGGTPGAISGAAGAAVYLTVKFLRTRPVKRRIIQGFVLSAAVFTAMFFLAGSVAGLAQRSSYTQAPDFQLSTLDGGSYRLSELKGKYVILNFWASWCAPCRAEVPELVEFHKESKADMVVLLGINQTASEAGISAVRNFAEQNSMAFPILLDTGNKVHGLYGIRGIPTTVIVDPNGVITVKRMGAVTGTWLNAALR